MKRLLTVIALFVCLLLVLVAATPFFVSTETVRARIVAEVEELTGRRVTFTGNPAVSFNPFLGIEIENVRLHDHNAVVGSEPFMRIEKLQGKLNFFPAFYGQADIGTYRLIHPIINLQVDSTGKKNWSLEKGALHSAIEQASSVRSEANNTSDGENQAAATINSQAISQPLGQFEIVDGIISYIDEIAGVSERFTQVHASMNWPATDRAMEIKGSGVWREELLEAKISAEKPIGLMANDVSQVTGTFGGSFFQSTFSGEANMLSDLLLKGNLSLNTSSPARMAKLSGINMNDSGPLGTIAISGLLTATPGQFEVRDAEVLIGSSSATGLVQMSIDERDRIKLGGTLAFDKADISSIITSLLKEDENLTPTNLFPETLFLDFRLSANEVKITDSLINEFAASFSGSGEDWLLDIGTARAFGGDVIAKLSSTKKEGEFSYGFDFSGTGLDATQISTLFSGNVFNLNGELKTNISVKSTAKSKRGLLRNLDGKMDMLVIDGDVAGFEMGRIVKALEVNEFPDDLIDSDSNTEFSKLAFDLLINRGVGWISSGTIESGEDRLMLRGKADFFLGGMAAQAGVTKIQNEESTDSAGNDNQFSQVENRLFIGGTFSSPLITSLPFRPEIQPKSGAVNPTSTNSGDKPIKKQPSN